MIDPDRGNSKTDVVFFAQEASSRNLVRILVQLTIAACSNQKITDSFDAMKKVSSVDDIADYRLFIGPKSNATYTDNSTDHCHLFAKQSQISETFELSIEQLCNPKSTENSIAALVQMAETLGNLALADQLAGDFGSLSVTNKKRRLPGMIFILLALS